MGQNYIPHTKKDQEEMLQTLGMNSLEELFIDIPDPVKLKRDLKLPLPLTEMDLKKKIQEISKRNVSLDDYTCFLGAGVYDHHVPSVVNHLLSRSEFYTAYTPYQAEISQGTLQAIFEFQTLICQLTELDVANASMYDGATAMTEAALMAVDTNKKKEILVSAAVHPEYREVLRTYSKALGIRVTEVSWQDGVTDLEELEKKVSPETAGVIIQSPNFFGCLEDLAAIEKITHQEGKRLLIACVNPLSLGILSSPGSLGVDIAVGEGQCLGNNLNFGGPGVGFLACTESLKRRLPGRVVGQTVDKEGRRGFVLTLQSREQHIRRAKATSNICSNQALNALAATIYLSYLGKEGIRKLAELCLQKAHYLAKEISKLPGYSLAFNSPFWQEFVVICPNEIEKVNQDLLQEKIVGGYSLAHSYPELGKGWLLAVTEKRSKKEMDNLVKVLGGLR